MSTLIKAETWDTKFEKVHLGGCTAIKSETEEVNQRRKKSESTRSTQVSIEINTTGTETVYSSETRRIERNMPPVWRDLRVQQVIH